MAMVIKQTNEKFLTGNGTVGVAAQVLSDKPFQAIKGVRIICTSGVIYVGNSAKVNAGDDFPIASAGDATVEIAAEDPNKIWIIGAAGGQTYKWIAS